MADATSRDTRTFSEASEKIDNQARTSQNCLLHRWAWLIDFTSFEPGIADLKLGKSFFENTAAEERDQHLLQQVP